jgi:trehalose synthase
MVRKVGGFSFQELNLTIDDIRTMSETGADLSYDFVNRPAYQHALVMGDTAFLRLTLQLSQQAGVAPISLVHGLQNHDELTHELVHFAAGHSEDEFLYKAKLVKGADLAVRIRTDLINHLTGEAAPYNMKFTTNGIACTTASVISAALGYRSLSEIGPDETETIKDAHLLLSMFNALQPGVFALSGWDLSGMLTLDPAEVSDLIREGDTRWINRGAHDLIGVERPERARWDHLPLGRSLYGPLPRQLDDPKSFASRLAEILQVRREHQIDLAELLDIPAVSHPAMLVLIHLLPSGKQHALTLNFSRQRIWGTVQSPHLVPGSSVSDMFGRWEEDTAVDALNSFHLALEPFEGFSLLIQPPVGPETDPADASVRVAIPTAAPYPPSAEEVVTHPTQEHRIIP